RPRPVGAGRAAADVRSRRRALSGRDAPALRHRAAQGARHRARAGCAGGEAARAGACMSAGESSQPFEKRQCVVCGFTYDEAAGLPDEGIAPGTRWADIPDSWNCAECGANKLEFEMVKI